MAKFKVGDRVRGTGADIAGGEFIIEKCYPNGTGFVLRCVKSGKYDYLNQVIDRGEICNWFPHMELIEAAGPITHILQYELDKDPFETFSSLKAVEARIKELADRHDLKRDSLVVYEVSKVMKVTLEHKVTMKEESSEETAETAETAETTVTEKPKVHGKTGQKRCIGCRRFFKARGLRRHQASCWRYQRSN